MKKYVPAMILLMISVLLLFDCMVLYPRVDWSSNASASSGIGLYLFGGLLEVNDSIPYCDTPDFFKGLCAATVSCFGLAVAAFVAGRRKRE